MKAHLAMIYFFVSMLVTLLTNFIMLWTARDIMISATSILQDINQTVQNTNENVADLHVLFGGEQTEVEIEIITE